MRKHADRVMEISDSEGLGNFTLLGAMVGYRTFRVPFPDDGTFSYCIEGQNDDGTLTGEWEVGTGHLNSNGELVRDKCQCSSNNDTFVSFSVGQKAVWLTLSSEDMSGFASAEDFNAQIETAMDNLETARASAVQEITTDHANAVAEITTKHTEAISQIATDRASALGDIESARSTAVQEITTDHSTALSEIESARIVALGNIETDRTTALANIETKRAESLADVETKRASSVESVETQETTSLGNIVDKELEAITHIESRMGYVAQAHQILEVFTTFRTDEGPVNGAYDCDGSEFSRDDFYGATNPYDLLVAGKAKTCTYEEYQTAIDTDGVCAHFALDTENEKFKVPTIRYRFLQPTPLVSEMATVMNPALPNITGSIRVFNEYNKSNASAENIFTGAFYWESAWDTDTSKAYGTSTNLASGSNDAVRNVPFDASRSNSIYKDGATVQPQAILVRAMVQLANTAEEISIDNYTKHLNDFSDELKAQLQSQYDTHIASWIEKYSDDNDAWDSKVIADGNAWDSKVATDNDAWDDKVSANNSSLDIKVDDIHANLEQTKQDIVDHVEGKVIAGRFIGEIIPSSMPIRSAIVALFDGAYLYSGGAYDDFVEYASDLEVDYPDLFITNEEFEESLSKYGSCGKYVLIKDDSGVVTGVRLPKVSDILQGTSDIRAVGQLIEAGLPNVIGSIATRQHTSGNILYGGAVTGNDLNGAFKFTKQGASYSSTAGVAESKITESTPEDLLEIDASQCSPVYRNDIQTVQQQAINTLFYVVVATATETEVTVNINNVMTDINNKLDKSGGAMTGGIRFVNSNDRTFNFFVTNSDDPDRTNADIGWNYETFDGALLGLRSADHANSGMWALIARNGDGSVVFSGYPDGRLLLKGEKVHAGTYTNKTLTVASAITCSTSVKTYDLSEYLPDDGYVYMVLLIGRVVTGATSGNESELRVYSDVVASGSYIWLADSNTRSASSMADRSSCWLPVGTERKLYVVNGAATGTFYVYARGYYRMYKA